MKKWIWFIGIFILIGIVFGGFYLNNMPKQKTVVNQTVEEKYTMAYNNSYYSKEVGMANGSWIIDGKMLELVDNSKFSYGGKIVAPTLVYSVASNCPSGIVGCWKNVSYYVIDYGGFYLVHTFNDAGPRIFGPFNSNDKPDDNSNSCISSNGTVELNSCFCPNVADFPNTCVVGVCSCNPMGGIDYKIKECNCGEGRCWNGSSCVKFKQEAPTPSCKDDDDCPQPLCAGCISTQNCSCPVGRCIDNYCVYS